MTITVKKILDSIELLSETEKQELVSEIIRRTTYLEFSPLTDDEFVFHAEDLFLELDKQDKQEEADE